MQVVQRGEKMKRPEPEQPVFYQTKKAARVGQLFWFGKSRCLLLLTAPV